MTFRLRGRSFTITPSDVLEVTRNVPPSQRDGRNKYFVTIHGHQYPIKQVLQLVSGLSRVGFTAQDAHRILSRLGFDIFEDQAPPPNGEITAGTTGGSTSRGVPAIGEATNQDDSDVRKLPVRHVGYRRRRAGKWRAGRRLPMGLDLQRTVEALEALECVRAGMCAEAGEPFREPARARSRKDSGGSTARSEFQDVARGAER